MLRRLYIWMKVVLYYGWRIDELRDQIQWSTQKVKIWLFDSMKWIRSWNQRCLYNRYSAFDVSKWKMLWTISCCRRIEKHRWWFDSGSSMTIQMEKSKIFFIAFSRVRMLRGRNGVKNHCYFDLVRLELKICVRKLC